MKTQSKLFRALGIVNIFALVLFLSVSGSAQSGRRLPKGSPPIATPEPPPEIKAAPIREPVKPEITLKVLSDISQGGSQVFLMPNRLHTWTVERLRRSSLLEVRNGGSTGRSNAIKQAKAETEAYTVLIEMQSDPFGPTRESSGREATVVVTVYHPVSGKVKFSRMMTVGQASMRTLGSSSVVQACYPGVYRNDLLLLEASIAAADTIMSSFSVPLPPICGGSSRV